MSMDSWFPNPHDKDISQLEEGLAYRAVKSGNNWILPSGKNAANGDPVVLDGVFGYATAAIVGGTDAIVEDTNWKPYGDGGALSALNSNIITGSYDTLGLATTTGNTTVIAINSYKLLVFGLRGEANDNAWITPLIIPYELFKTFNSSYKRCIINNGTLTSEFHYVDDTSIMVDTLTANRGLSIYGIK